jgi:transcriptional regulator with XRE-family HTH domain
MSDTPISPPDVAIGRVLRELRLNRNIKQLELAQALGVTRATVTRWELGSRAMTVSTLLAIADLLDAPASLLLPERHQAPVSDTHHGPEQAAIRAIDHILEGRPDLIPTVIALLAPLVADDVAMQATPAIDVPAAQ